MTEQLFDFLNEKVFPLMPEMVITELLNRIAVETADVRIETINNMTKRNLTDESL